MYLLLNILFCTDTLSVSNNLYRVHLLGRSVVQHHAVACLRRLFWRDGVMGSAQKPNGTKTRERENGPQDWLIFYVRWVPSINQLTWAQDMTSTRNLACQNANALRDAVNQMCSLCLSLHTGTLFLWMFWPSFNSAVIYQRWDRGLKLSVIYGTYLSLAVSVVVAMTVSMLTSSKGKMNMVSVCRNSEGCRKVDQNCNELTRTINITYKMF